MKADHPTIMANYRPWQHQGLAGLTITQEAPFKWRARTETCDAIVIHESAGTNPAKTLRRKSLGCHFIIGPGGHVMQHNDISARVSHASKMNDRSIGIEVINPYYPPPTQSWIDVIDNAPWAHKKRYLVPTLKQLEATAQLVGVLTSASLDGVEIPRFFTGLATHGSSGGVSTAMAMASPRTATRAGTPTGRSLRSTATCGLRLDSVLPRRDDRQCN